MTNYSLEKEQETHATITAQLFIDSTRLRLQLNKSKKTILARPATSITFGLVYKTLKEKQKPHLITVVERASSTSAVSNCQEYSIFLSDRDENCNVKLHSFYFLTDSLFDALCATLQSQKENDRDRTTEKIQTRNLTPDMFYVEIENAKNTGFEGNRFFRRCNFDWRNTKIKIRRNEIVNFRPKHQDFAINGRDGRESIVTINMNDTLGNNRDLVTDIVETISKERKPIARINSELIKVRPGSLDARLFIERIDRLWTTMNDPKTLASVPWEDLSKFYISDATTENEHDKVRNLICDITYLFSSNLSIIDRNEIFEYLNERLSEEFTICETLSTGRRRDRTFGSKLTFAKYRKSNAVRFFHDNIDYTILHLMRSMERTGYEIKRSTIKTTRCANRTIARTSNCAKYKQKRVSGRSLTIDLLLLPPPAKRTTANRHSLATSNGQLFTNGHEFTFLERTKLIAITVCPEATSENVNLAWFVHNDNSEQPPVSLAIPYSEKHGRPTTIDTCITFILNERYLRPRSKDPQSPQARTFSPSTLRHTMRFPYTLTGRRKKTKPESRIFALRGDATLMKRLVNFRDGSIANTTNCSFRIPVYNEQSKHLASIRLDPISLIAANDKESTKLEYGIVSRVNGQSRKRNSENKLKRALTIVRKSVSFVTRLTEISSNVSIGSDDPKSRLHEITKRLKFVEQEYAKQTLLFLNETKRANKTTRYIVFSIEQLFRAILLTADELLLAKDYDAYRNLNILLFDIRSQLTNQRE